MSAKITQIGMDVIEVAHTISGTKVVYGRGDLKPLFSENGTMMRLIDKSDDTEALEDLHFSNIINGATGVAFTSSDDLYNFVSANFFKQANSAAGNGAAGLLPINSRIAAGWDSITNFANGSSGGSEVSYRHAYLTQALLLSNGYFFLPKNGNQGIPGNTTAQALARVGDLNALRPDVVVDLSGTNNIGGDINSVVFDKKRLIKDYFDNGVKYTVLLSIMPFYGSHYSDLAEANRKGVNTTMKAFAATDSRIKFVDLDPVASNPDYYVDGLHPTPFLAYLIGNEVAKVLKTLSNQTLSIFDFIKTDVTYNSNLLFKIDAGNGQVNAPVTGKAIDNWSINSGINIPIIATVGIDEIGSYQQLDIVGSYQYDQTQQAPIYLIEKNYNGILPVDGDYIENISRFKLLKNDQNLVAITPQSAWSKPDYSGKVFATTGLSIYDEYDSNNFQENKIYEARTPPAVVAGSAAGSNPNVFLASLNIILKPQTALTPINLSIRIYNVVTRKIV